MSRIVKNVKINEEGKDADIVIMSSHSFDNFSTINMVLVDSEIAYKAGGKCY